jgi:hypothetical protein
MNTNGPRTRPMTAPQDKKAFVLTAFDTLFNQRDYAAARLAEHWDVI